VKSAILDTNVLITFLEKGGQDLAATLSVYDEIVLTPTVLGEYRAGIGPDKRGPASEAALNEFLSQDSVRTVEMTAKTAIFYAKVYRALKDAGRPIPVNDIWIAASALEHAVELCSFDAHFSAIPMLQFERL